MYEELLPLEFGKARRRAHKMRGRELIHFLSGS